VSLPNVTQIPNSAAKVTARTHGRGILTPVRKIWREIIHDDCIDMAAEMAYFFVLAIFPFFVVLGALAGFLPYSNLWTCVSNAIIQHFPTEARRLALQTFFNLTHRNETFLSVGSIAMAWTSSSGVVCLMENLSRVYNVAETRGFWKKRLIAFGVVIVTSAFFVVSFGLLTLGHRLGSFLVAEFHLGPGLRMVWEIFRWGFLIAMLQTAVAIIDSVLPNKVRPWRWITPGTIFITGMLLAGTWGVNFYVRHVGHYYEIYGAIGAFFVLMVWIFVSSLTFLVGAEMNAVFEER
jgi:membrane protein